MILVLVIWTSITVITATRAMKESSIPRRGSSSIGAVETMTAATDRNTPPAIKTNTNTDALERRRGEPITVTGHETIHLTSRKANLGGAEPTLTSSCLSNSGIYQSLATLCSRKCSNKLRLVTFFWTSALKSQTCPGRS